MNQSEIQSAIALEQKAFAFLLASRASGHAASRPLDEATLAAWQHADSCAAWITRHYDELPSANRPEREEVRAFSQFLSSFFATSFSVSKTRRDGEIRIQIRALPTRRLDGSRKSNHLKEKERKAADALRQMALTALAAECGASATDAHFSQTHHDATLAADLTLWTYARQLVNRSEYASQGPAGITSGWISMRKLGAV